MASARNPSGSGGFLAASATTQPLPDGLRALKVGIHGAAPSRFTHPTRRLRSLVDARLRIRSPRRRWTGSGCVGLRASAAASAAGARTWLDVRPTARPFRGRIRTRRPV
ncbi:hypothetical protein G6F24_017300 [Rhizopus arrhizus]|nr:hypothetical protein G6F24_017300 [Rhizopus arrhizus]